MPGKQTFYPLILQRTVTTDYAILIAPDGIVKFGTIDKDGKDFRCAFERNIDVDSGVQSEFRLILRANIGEFYLNNYQISLITFGGTPLAGHIGFFGFDEDCPARDLKAWKADPDYGTR